jgi:hypothetical protein
MLLNHKYTENCRDQTTKVSEILILSNASKSQIHSKLQKSNVPKVSEILILLKPSISQIYLKLQRPVVQSIRNSDTFETLYIYTTNILKTAEIGSPKYQKF